MICASKRFQFPSFSRGSSKKDRLEDLTDANLIRFLRGRKYDMERALETTVEMRRFKNENPDWFNPTPEALVVFDMFCGLLPTPSPHGRRPASSVLTT